MEAGEGGGDDNKGTKVTKDNGSQAIVVVDWKLLGIETTEGDKGHEEGTTTSTEGADGTGSTLTKADIVVETGDTGEDSSKDKEPPVDAPDGTVDSSLEIKSIEVIETDKIVGDGDSTNNDTQNKNTTDDDEGVSKMKDKADDNDTPLQNKVEDKVIETEVATATAAVVDSTDDQKMEQPLPFSGGFDKNDIVVIDVDDDSNDEEEECTTAIVTSTAGMEVEGEVPPQEINSSDKNKDEISSNTNDSKDQNEMEETLDKKNEEGEGSDDKLEESAGTKGDKETRKIEEVIMIEDSSNASSAVVNVTNVNQQQQQGQTQNGPSSFSWDQEKVLLISEIESLRGKLNRLMERQMLLEDFALVEYSARFRTFFHARDLLLQLGKKRTLSDPSQALAPGSSYLIEILRIINEKAEGEIEELHITEKDIVAIEEKLKKLKSRLADSSFGRSSESKSENLDASISSSVSEASFAPTFPPTLPHKFTADNQPVYDSGVPSGVLKNPLYKSGQQQQQSRMSGSQKRALRRARSKVDCEVCHLSMNAGLYRNKHIYEHVGIIFACPVCKEKKGQSHRDANKCLRLNHGVVPGQTESSQVLRYIQDSDGSFRLLSSKEEMDAELKSFLAKFHSLSSEEKEQIKSKYLADQERSSRNEEEDERKKDDFMTSNNFEKGDDGKSFDSDKLIWDMPKGAPSPPEYAYGQKKQQSTPSEREKKGDSNNEDIEILEVVPGTPTNNNKAPPTESGKIDSKVKEPAERNKKLEEPSSSTGPKLGKPFPVPTIAISSSSTSNDNSVDPDNSEVLPPIKPIISPPASGFIGGTGSKKKKNRGRKRAGYLPLGTPITVGSPSVWQNNSSSSAGKYLAPSPTKVPKKSGLSMASRSILGRDTQRPPPPRPLMSSNISNPNFINATYDNYDSSYGPIRPTFGPGRVSPYPNTSGMGVGRGRVGPGGVGPGGISSYVGTGRGLTNNNSGDPSITRRLVPMPSSASLMDEYESSRYSSNGGPVGRGGGSTRNIPEERFKLNASCLGDTGGRGDSSRGSLKRFDYSNGMGQNNNNNNLDSSLTDDCPSPSLLAERPSFYEIDLGFEGAEYRKKNPHNFQRNTANSSGGGLGRGGSAERSGAGTGFAFSPITLSSSPEKPSDYSFFGNRDQDYNSNNSAMFSVGGFEERFTRSEETNVNRDQILRNPRYSGPASSSPYSTSGNYIMASRPAQYGYFTSPGSGGSSGAAGGGGGGGTGNRQDYSQDQFGSYAEYAKNVLSKNRSDRFF